MTRLVAVLLILLCPISIAGARYVWTLHRRALESPGLQGFSFVFAITNALSAMGATVLGLVAFFYVGGQEAVASSLWSAVLVAFVVLDSVPIINALYLRYIDGKEGRAQGK